MLKSVSDGKMTLIPIVSGDDSGPGLRDTMQPASQPDNTVPHNEDPAPEGGATAASDLRDDSTHSPVSPGGLRGVAANVALPFLILVAAVAIGAILLETPPQVSKSTPEKLAAVVGVRELTPEDIRVFVDAFGSVIPSREVRVMPEVSGRVIELNPRLIPGGLIGAGESLFRIDPADYDIAVAQAKADLDVARHEAPRIRASIDALRERAAQMDVEIAYLQWNADRLGKLAERNSAAQSEARDAKTKLDSQIAARRALDADIAERENAAEAAIAQARAAERKLESAELMRSRTNVVAPFDAIVISEDVEAGQLVSPQSTIATLAATDSFWAEASIPVARLRDIRFAVDATSEPSRVDITMSTGGADITRDGVALRPLGNLDPEGRMARVLVSVQDPLGLTEDATAAARRVLLGSYVRLRIDAGVLRHVYAIPRKALRENDRIWVRNADGNLAIRPVKILWRRQEDVLIQNGFEPGDQLVDTHLASVVPGMPLNIREESAPTTSAAADPSASTSTGAAP